MLMKPEWKLVSQKIVIEYKKVTFVILVNPGNLILIKTVFSIV